MEQKLTTTVDGVQDGKVSFRLEQHTDERWSVPLQNVFMRDGSSASNLIRKGDIIELGYDDSVLKAILCCEVSIENVIDFDDKQVKFKLNNSYTQFEWPIEQIYNPNNMQIKLSTQLKIDRVHQDVRRVSYYDENSPARLAQTQYENIHSTGSDIYPSDRTSQIQAQYGSMDTTEEAKSTRQIQSETSSAYSCSDISNPSVYQGAAPTQSYYENQGYQYQIMNRELPRRSSESVHVQHNPASVHIQYNPERQKAQESVPGSYQMFRHLNTEPSVTPANLSNTTPSELQNQMVIAVPPAINPYLYHQNPERHPTTLQSYQLNPIIQDQSSKHPSIKIDNPVQQDPSVMPYHYNPIPYQQTHHSQHITYNPLHIAPNPTHQSYSLPAQPLGNQLSLPHKSITSNPSPYLPLSQHSIPFPTYANMLPGPNKPEGRLEEKPSVYPSLSQQPKLTSNPIIPEKASPYNLREPYKPKGRFEELLNRKLETCGNERLPIISLKEDFKGSRSIQARIELISSKFDSWRRVRGDGNCYYRAVAVAYLEHLYRYTTDIQEIQDFLNKSRQSEYFLEEDRLYFLQNLHDLYAKKYKGVNVIPELNEKLQDTKFDRGMIGVFRLLAANYLNMNRENPDIRDFVFDMQGDLNRMITMGIEAEGMEFHCMSGALGVFIKHISLVDENDNVFLCNRERAPILFILYKKGHYDLLYNHYHNQADGYSLTSYQFQEPKYEIDNQVFIGKFYVSKKEAEVPSEKVKQLEERKAPPVVDLTRQGNQEIPNIPKSASQARDTCLFCNQLRNEDEFYRDKICKCKMCLSCYFEQQSFTTCKKCYEPLSMQKMSTCKTCREKKLERYIVTLDCNHDYCKECLKDHIQFELSRRNGRVSCPDHNCQQLISIDIRNQIIQSAYGQDDKNNKSYEHLSSNPHGRSICNICNSSDAFVFITRLDCNHLICTDCLKEYLEYKITHDLLKRKGIECCICDFRISDDVIKSVLDQGAYNQYISKMGILFNMKVKCPKKHITVAHRKHNECDVCKIKFCVICKKDPHQGICERRNFWGRKYKDSCPECNKRNEKAYKSYKEYVICKNPDCNTSYCRLCYQRYSPILAHGPIYHKYDCLFHRHSHNKPSYNPIQCEDCKKLGVLCPNSS